MGSHLEAVFWTFLNQRESHSKRPVALVLGAGVELFHDERGEPYATVSLSEGRTAR